MQYTYVGQIGSKILHRWVDDEGKHQAELANFCPTLFIPTRKPDALFHGIRKEPLVPKNFDSIWNAREYVREHDSIEGFNIYGNQNWWAQFIQEEYEGDITWTPDVITIAYLDIEVLMDKGFPEPNKALSEITSISVTVPSRGTWTFATKPYKGENKQLKFVHSVDEKRLIFEFLSFWKELEPHIVSGWNIQAFDIPYLVNRIRKILGDEYANLLAPTAKRFTKKCINERQYDDNIEYTLNGITILDYMRLYKKFTFKMREKYSLDYIAHVELGEKKLDYSEYGNLDIMWEENPTKYINYNARDTTLVERLDKKLNLMMLVFTLTYMCHIRFDDPLSQVRMWDTLIYNKMLEKNVVIPPKNPHFKSEKYEGAWVRDPEIGMHEWVVSFDLNSLYPHLIMQYNISPEKIIDREEIDNPLMFGFDDLVNKEADLDFLKDLDLSMTANKAFFERDSQGFLPQMMELLYNQRKTVKKQQLAAEQDVEDIKALLHERGVSIDD